MKKTKFSNLNVCYLHGRPSAHYSHANFAKSVGSVFQYIDFRLRWQDKNKGAIHRLISWVVCAASYPKKKDFQVFLVDNLHFSPIIMKLFFIKRKRQKVVVYMGSHTLYFMYAKKFAPMNLWLHKQILNLYDAVICEGDMAIEFAASMLWKKNAPPLYKVFNGIPDHQNYRDCKSIPNLKQKNILFIGAADSAFRFHYKGIDMMLQAFDLAFQQDPELKFTLIGPREEQLYTTEINKISEEARQAITLIDYSENLSEFILASSLYLHCARGDAFPTTVIIAMSAGLPTIVSEFTGAKEAVKKVSGALVSSQCPQSIADRITWYFNLPEKEKLEVSQKSKLISNEYTEEKAVSHFQKTFYTIVEDLKILD